MVQATLGARAAAPAAGHPHPLARWPVLAITCAVVLVHVAVSPFGEHWIDEVYMLAAGKYHPDWGYADQPPIAPLVAAAMDWLAPGSLPLLRLPAVLVAAAAVPLTALITREFGGDRRAQVIASAATATGLWAALIGHWVTPYTFEPTLWLLLTWLLVRWIRLHHDGRPDDRLLLAAGAVTGLTLQTKFQILILGAALLLTMLVFGPRRQLARPMLLAAAAIAVLIALPTLIWQANHDWPQLRMGPVVAQETPVLSGGRLGTAASTLLYAGIAGAPLLCYGVWRLVTAAEMRMYRFLGVTTVLLYVFFVATAARPYYLLGLYGVAFAAGAVGLQRRREVKRARLRWVAWPAFGLSAAAALGVVWLSIGFTSSLLGITSPTLVADAGHAYNALPEQTRSHTAILTQNYVAASYLDVLGSENGLPRAFSPHRGYGYFPPPDEAAQHVLYVGSDPGALREHFTEVEQLPGNTAMWFLSGKQESWAVLWPEVRHL
ncbi:glycosyltransferase family 39 protein [Saccharopolyspora taberi]|uniref:Glycosyltransferase family 39 protein n=1 Tax=Saccharopolyspora taberi TaxID=60895 RepID=A0ABN3VJ87_9PSEU